MAKRSDRRAVASCPCGSGAPYDQCCGALHQGRAAAATAEQLMRSRYAAFVVGDADYLLRTWATATRPPDLSLDNDLRWTGLEILATTAGTPFHTEGSVEFRAGFIADGHPGDQYEHSRFVREDGLWVYVEAL
ncbi:YchJ family protein [Kribbella sancticallisti]|uniref:UPF0225 protein GCM10009789_10520 n=1 Tax=Kribbella sancticallisti TaxID=460087 RepID=A0ABP4NB20_9ACTN